MKKDEKLYTGIRLEKSIRKKAIKIGNGNLTEGIRKAITEYRKKK